MDRFILDSSRGLAEATKGKHPTIHFIHESVREYLLSAGMASLKIGLSVSLTEKSHDALRQCCQHYLIRSGAALLPIATDGLKEFMARTSQDISALRSQIATTHPFLGYAIEGIVYHANLAHSAARSKEAFVAAFPHKLWRRLYNLGRPYHTRRLQDNSALLYSFVSMGASKLAEIEIRNQAPRIRENIVGEYYASLLGAAIASEDATTVDVLVQCGADPYAPATSKHDCLSLAIAKKNSSMVKSLLKCSIVPGNRARDLLQQDGRYLHLALDTASPNWNTIEVILAHMPYSQFWYWPLILTKALLYAKWSGSDAVEKLLLEKLNIMSTKLASSTIAMISEDHVNAFVAACSHGDTSLVSKFLEGNILLVKGAVPRAMYGAVSENQVQAVRILLDNGIDVDVPLNDTLDSVLSMASARNHNDMVRLLLDRKANVNRRNKLGSTALLVASRRGHTGIVQTLMSFGADSSIHSRPGNPYRPLHRACIHGNLHVVRMLLQQPGTEVDALDGDNNHALSLASECEQVGCVQLLLEKDIPTQFLDQALKEVSDGGGSLAQLQTKAMLIAKGATVPTEIGPPTCVNIHA